MELTNRKLIISIIAVVALGCAVFLALPYIFVSAPKSPVLIVYTDTNPAMGLYVLKYGILEVLAGDIKEIKVDDPDRPGIRRATEDEGYWRKVVNRKRINLNEEQFQKLMELANELDSRQVEVVPGLRPFAVPEIYVWYNDQYYGMYVTDGIDFDVNDPSAISSSEEYTLMRGIAKIVMESSPIPIEPLPSPSQPTIRS